MSRPRSPQLQPDVDRRLVERCLEGEARAWDELVRRHERLVYAVARSFRLSDPDLADVFQDVFAALVQGLPRIRDGRALVRWLSTTTQRIAYAAALRARRRDALAPATDPADLDRVADAGPGLDASLEAHEEQALIRMALARLNERCRKLLQALFYEDPQPSYREVAVRLGVPVGSLGPTRARCFDAMRAVLDAPSEGAARISGRSSPTSGSGKESLPKRRASRSGRRQSSTREQA